MIWLDIKRQQKWRRIYIYFFKFEHTKRIKQQKCRYLAYKSFTCASNCNSIYTRLDVEKQSKKNWTTNRKKNTHKWLGVHAKKWVYQPFCNILFCKSEQMANAKKVVALRFRCKHNEKEQKKTHTIRKSQETERKKRKKRHAKSRNICACLFDLPQAFISVSFDIFLWSFKWRCNS